MAGVDTHGGLTRAAAFGALVGAVAGPPGAPVPGAGGSAADPGAAAEARELLVAAFAGLIPVEWGVDFGAQVPVEALRPGLPAAGAAAAAAADPEQHLAAGLGLRATFGATACARVLEALRTALARAQARVAALPGEGPAARWAALDALRVRALFDAGVGVMLLRELSWAHGAAGDDPGAGSVQQEGLSFVFDDEVNLRTVLEQAPIGVAVAHEGRIVYVNRTISRLLGHAGPRAMLGMDALSVFHPDERPELAATALRILRDGTPGTVRERRVLTRDGGVLWAEMQAVPVRLHGEGALAIIARDVTERHQMQSRLVQADRLATVGLLAAGVVHEINNPLTPLLFHLGVAAAAARLLQGRADPGDAEAFRRFEELRESLEAAKDGADRIRAIVGDIRSLSRVSEQEMVPVDINATIQRTLNLTWGRFRHRARLVKDFGALPAVVATEGRLAQVFLNLIVNAAQALVDEAAAHNEIRIRTWADADGVWVEIRDNGPGIAPEHLGVLFDPFFTTKAPGEGTGLGLTICRDILRSFGGEIGVSSAPGEGASFTVRLPRPSAPAPEPAEGPAGASQVLVFEPDPMLARAIHNLLAREYGVCLARTVNEARAALGDPSRPIGAVVAAVGGPGGDGVELHDWLAEAHPVLARRAVYLMGPDSARVRAFRASTRAVLLDKPGDIRLLRQVLRSVFDLGGPTPHG